MNTVLAFLVLISLICIPVFILLTIIKLVRKQSPKKHFIISGVSALVFLSSFIGFGITMDEPVTNEAKSYNESSYVAMSAETSTPEPDVTPTPKPTASPTPKPTASPTPKPSASPTPKPTASPTPEPTASPTPEPTVPPTPEPTVSPTLAPTASPAPEPTVAPTPEPPSAGSPDNGSGNNNFDTYDNPEQQKTEDSYVLNTSSMKIHYPGCSSVAKIAPKNYATSSESVEELKARGYTTCGRCFK